MSCNSSLAWSESQLKKMIDQINELPEDGLKSLPKTLLYIERIHGLVKKLK